MAQDAVPCGVRARAAGLLGGPQQRGQGGSAREQFVDVLAGQHAAVVVGVGTGVRGSPAQRVRGHVHGPLGREPPDGLGQVAARGEGVTTVALEGHRAQGGVGQPTLPVEACERKAHDGEDHLVRAHPVGLGCAFPHGPRRFPGDLEISGAGGRHGVHGGLQCAVAQGYGRPRGQHPFPARQVLPEHPGGGPGGHHVHGVAPGGGDIGDFRQGPGHGGVVRAFQVRDQDLPRDGVHGEVVHGDHEAVTVRGVGPGGQHGRADHGARAWVQLLDEGVGAVLRSARGAGAGDVAVPVPGGSSVGGTSVGGVRGHEDVDGGHRAAAPHEQCGFLAGRIEHQAQGVVAVEDRLQGTRQGSPVQGTNGVEGNPLRVRGQRPRGGSGRELRAHHRGEGDASHGQVHVRGERGVGVLGGGVARLTGAGRGCRGGEVRVR